MRRLTYYVVEFQDGVLVGVRREPEKDLFENTAGVLRREHIGREVVHQRKHHHYRKPVPEDSHGDRYSGINVFRHISSILTKHLLPQPRNHHVVTTSVVQADSITAEIKRLKSLLREGSELLLQPRNHHVVTTSVVQADSITAEIKRLKSLPRQGSDWD